MTGAEAGLLSGRRVVVTGGAGVIATEMLRQLGDAGAEVLSIDRLPLAEPPPAGTRHVVGDLADMDLDVIADFRPAHVLHLAATFERSIESPEFWDQNWRDNVVVSHRLVELAQRLGGVESFVFASSYLVYDPAQYLSDRSDAAIVPLQESSRLLPRNLCGAAKLYAEAELAFASEVAGATMRISFARIFRVYGRGSRDVVSRWVRSALAGEPIEVYHAENRFDYVFSGDVAEGLVRIALAADAHGPINLASGSPRRVADVIAAIESATGRTLEARHVDVDEPYEASAADLARLREVLDWAPSTTLEAGVRRLAAFESARAAGETIPA